MKIHGLNDHPLIVFKTSEIHGRGGFARIDLRRGKCLIEYVGPRLSKAEAKTELHRQNVYLFALDGHRSIDGSVDWNLARFLNHSCAPNCKVKKSRDRIWLYTRCRIRAGEELTYNYGYDLEDYEHYPCHCGSPTCVGYMAAEACFATLQQRQQSDVTG